MTTLPESEERPGTHTGKLTNDDAFTSHSVTGGYAFQGSYMTRLRDLRHFLVLFSSGLCHLSVEGE